MRYYEDLVEGVVEESGTRTLTREELIAFASQYDPQYFHADEQAAKDSIFGEVIASGIYTMAIWRQLDHQIAQDIQWICGVAWDDVRFPKAVRAGDTLRARAKCLARRPSGSDPRRGVVTYEYVLLNQRDEIVFTCRSTNLVERRTTGIPAGTHPAP
jgi:acyl dehydratase